LSLLKRVLPLLFVFLIPALAGDFEISISQPAQAGAAKLAPGRYKVKVQGSLVIFTDPASNRSITSLARVERLDKRSEFTAVLGSMVDGVQHVNKMILTGAEYTLGFAD
jgi:hypothetical protein